MPESVPTRHEDLGSNDAAGPGVTRHEAAPAGPLPTVHESTTATAGWSVLAPDALPAALAARLTDLRPMRTAGGEATLMQVRDAAFPAGDRVLKVYYPHIEPDRDVWLQLAAIRSPHVVEVMETGILADGRFFELMEFLPDGSLRDAGAGRDTFDPAAVTVMVRKLAAGLGILHGRGITHRDLKPENVLVRRNAGELEPVLTDFGLNRRLEASAHFTTGARTSAYAAPEAWAGHVSPARDWWSLGIMVLELATGQQPFAGLDERMIQKAITTKPVPVDAITDSRLHRLCAGLLVSDETKRWNGIQVHEWLLGGSPAVPDRRVPLDVTAFEFGGSRYLDPESLAAAMARDWRVAARRFGISPSPSWTALTTWLHQFDDPDRYPAGVVEDRLDLLGQLESSREVPNAKLVRLLAGLNPKQPPVYRQAHIDAAKLRELARRAQDGPPPDTKTIQAHEIIGELWDAKLLGVLATFEGAAELATIGARWVSEVQKLNTAVAELKRDPRLSPVLSGKEHRPPALASTLEFAAGAPRGDDWLRELRSRAVALPVAVDWFDRVVRWAGTDPARAYAALTVSGLAQAEAQQVVIARQAAERTRLAREQAWADHEQRRLDGRGSATGRAVGGAALLCGLWLVAALFTQKTPVLAVVMVLVMGAHLAVEISLAQVLGADYHPTYSLLQYVQEAAGRLGSRMRWSPGWAAVGIIVTIVLMGVLPWLVPVAAIGAALAHGIWAMTRHRRWSEVHEQDHHRVLSQ